MHTATATMACSTCITVLLFDNIQFSKATSQHDKPPATEVYNPAPLFSREVKTIDIEKLRDNLGICTYFQNLLESNNCQLPDYEKHLICSTI